jgi:predicted DNA-binding protein (UPF0251 family)
MQRRNRKVGYKYNQIYYKPQGIPLSQLGEVNITTEQLETLRLRYMEKLDQATSAKKMGISQSQYQRDISEVLESITEALVNGYAIGIEI